MVHSERQVLIIALHDRIDSQTASNTDASIWNEIHAHSPLNVILDMADVPYLSSAGLRVILKVKKAYNNLKIIHVQPDVYDVFDMTGFTSMMDIQKAMRKISVEGCEVLGQGGHGTVYRLDEDTIIKVYGEKESFDEIQREINYAKTAFIYGIPTAIAFDVVECQGRYGAVFELIQADTLGNVMKKTPETFASYQAQYLELIDILHTTKVDTAKFESTKSLYRQWIDDSRDFYTEAETDVLRRIISSIPDRETLVHGDIHLKNVMVQNGELVLIDMADLTYGHPIFDFAGMCLTHSIMPKRTPQYAISIAGLEAEPLLSLWEAVLTHTFGSLPKAEQESKRRLVEQFAMLKYALTPSVNKNMPDQIKQAIIQNAKATFFPVAECMVGAIKD